MFNTTTINENCTKGCDCLAQCIGQPAPDLPRSLAALALALAGHLGTTGQAGERLETASARIHPGQGQPLRQQQQSRLGGAAARCQRQSINSKGSHHMQDLQQRVTGNRHLYVPAFWPTRLQQPACVRNEAVHTLGSP